MRISDWSSDVCSSDLVGVEPRDRGGGGGGLGGALIGGGVERLALEVGKIDGIVVAHDQRADARARELLDPGAAAPARAHQPDRRRPPPPPPLPATSLHAVVPPFDHRSVLY